MQIPASINQKTIQRKPPPNPLQRENYAVQVDLKVAIQIIVVLALKKTEFGETSTKAIFHAEDSTFQRIKFEFTKNGFTSPTQCDH
ncbi:MAG TPA: hypothetical protein DCM62_01365 [Bacteroidales bacterium]|nr:hypothetical protein [Bacteroidales bacterium]